MGLSKEAIDELKKIHKEKSGETLSDAEVEEMGLRLLRLFKIIYRPIPEDAQSSENTKNPSDRRAFRKTGLLDRNT